MAAEGRSRANTLFAVDADETCRVRADWARRSAWFQRELLAAATHPLVAVDPNRTVIYWNRAAEAMFGWTQAEALGQRSTDLITREETPEQIEGLIAAISRGQSWSGEYEAARRDGSWISVYVTNTPIFDHSGQLVAVAGVCTDVTGRRGDEVARSRLAAIVDGSGDAIYGTTTEGLVTSWNGAAERLFGFTAEEIIGRSVAVLAPPGREWEQRQKRLRLRANGGHERFETVRTRKDGRLVDVLITASTTTDEVGEVTGFSVIAHDITGRIATRRALETSERRLADAQRTARLGSVELEVSTGAMSWSPEMYRILGLDPDLAPTVELFRATVHPSDLPSVISAWSGIMRNGVSAERDFRILHPDGTERFIRARGVPQLAADGSVVRVATTMLDDTARVLADRVRRSAEHRFEVGFEQSGIGATLVDLYGVPTRVNAALCALLGRTEAELTQGRLAAFAHPDEIPLAEVVRTRVLAGHDSHADERRYVRPDGSVVWASTHVTLVRDDEGKPEYFSAQLEDITDRKRMEAELSHHALHDSLTGLPNRGLLLDRLAQRRPECECAVLVINADRLESVNESYGLEVGDELLRQMARRIVEAGRPGDTTARGNGHEFVVVSQEVSLLEAELVASSILAALLKPFVCGGHQLLVTASVGIAIAAADQVVGPEALVRDAGVAVRRAKARGSARVELFDEDLREQAERHTAMGVALQEGLERREFTVHYQPVVDLDTGALVSAEALVRWNRPGHGLVRPDDFIPLAEESGLIIPIGAWVLEEACRQLVEWQRSQPSMTVAVNLSVCQIAAPDIVDLVQDVLQRTGVAPASVCLELTESVLMEDVDHFRTMLEGLRALGVRLSIDDFGTGYSALSYLKRFALDGVKVDRTFVSGLCSDANDAALVIAIIAMADALGLELTAEGVETEEQLLRLKSLGCRRAQGYYLARPVRPDDVTQMIAEGRRWSVGVPAGEGQRGSI